MVSKIIVKWLKFTFVLSTASFVIIQIQMRRSGDVGTLDTEPVDMVRNIDRGRGEVGPNAAIIPPRQSTALRNDNSATAHANESLSAGRTGTVEEDLLTGQEIRQIIENHNSKFEVYNEQEFGPVENVEYVIVVQVHNRTKYLEQLIHSLSRVKGIDRTLLIFSHDYYSNQLNNIVRAVRFCRVMQIFYPYSMQIYEDRFPGQDPKDCPGNIGREKAQQVNCQNWRSPDKYGHYRIAEFSQVKHHWWWKMNYAFDGIPRLRNYTGWVVLLEEDHYVTPDFVHTFDYMVRNKEQLCAECRVIALGFYLKSYSAYAATMDHLAVFPWFSSRHNMGMAINRATWDLIRECSEMFCTYDDYNWDWSLMRVNLKCMKQPMTVIFTKSPRVFHIGDCGIHHTGKQCTADASATKAHAVLESVKDRLFPAQFEVVERSSRTLKAPKENGGWGDIRDHQLCRNNSNFMHQVTYNSSTPNR